MLGQERTESRAPQMMLSTPTSSRKPLILCHYRRKQLLHSHCQGYKCCPELPPHLNGPPLPSRLIVLLYSVPCTPVQMKLFKATVQGVVRSRTGYSHFWSKKLFYAWTTQRSTTNISFFSPPQRSLQVFQHFSASPSNLRDDEHYSCDPLK